MLLWVILVGANILNDRSGLKAEQGPSLEKAWKLTIGLERRAKEIRVRRCFAHPEVSPTRNGARQ
jgi:hypothetical protein